MTTPETAKAKDQVLAWVRSKNPASMELKFGCGIQRENGRIETINDVSFTGNGGQSVFHTGKSTFFSNLFTADKWTYEKNGTYWATRNGGEICRILGSDMGLAELHIAFPFLQGWTSGGGQFFIGWNDVKGDPLADGELSLESVPFDLTKNLHEQSDEFYEAILPFLP